MLGALISPGRDPLKLFRRLAATYGDVVHFRLGSERVFFINHPQHIRDVLVTNQRNFTKSRGLERAKKLLGEGLLTSEGAAHLRQRRLLQPAFHRDRIAAYASVMVEHADRLQSRWEDHATIDISKEMMRVTLSIVGKTLFDTDVESKADHVGVAVTDVLETFWFNLLPFQSLIDRLPIPVLRRARAATRAARRADLQDDRRRRAVGGDRATSSRCSSPRERRGGWREGLTDMRPRQAMTLLLASHETTANALLDVVSPQPDAGRRDALARGLDRVLEGRRPARRRAASPLVRRIVAESMRLYPPAWMVGRRAIADYAIGDYVVPARAMIVMSPYVIQRDVRFFQEPERFMPDRWTPEFKAALPKFSYFPFGGGARQCIGEQFAWMELVLLVATIAQRWQFSLVPGHPVVPQPLVTLRAKHGMKVVAEKRGG
jgi:cytochrome P450